MFVAQGFAIMSSLFENRLLVQGTVQVWSQRALGATGASQAIVEREHGGKAAGTEADAAHRVCRCWVQFKGLRSLEINRKRLAQDWLQMYCVRKLESQDTNFDMLTWAPAGPGTPSVCRGSSTWVVGAGGGGAKFGSTEGTRRNGME